MGRDLDDQGFPVQMLQFNGCAQEKVGKAHRQGHDEIGTRPLEPVMRFNFKFDEEITWFANPLRCCLTFPAHAHARSILRSFWNGKP